MQSATTIMHIVAGERAIPLDLLRSRTTTVKVTHARQEICWASRQRTGLSLAQIGRVLGGRDHTTVRHAIRAVDDRMARDPDYLQHVQNLMQIIDATPEAGPETAIERARRVIAKPETASITDAGCMAISIAGLTSVLTNPSISAADAVAAAQQILNTQRGGIHA